MCIYMYVYVYIHLHGHKHGDIVTQGHSDGFGLWAQD